MVHQKTVSKADDIYIPDHRIEWEPSPRWVRVRFGGETIADSKRVMLMRETGHLPVYYFPQADVRLDLLAASDHTTSSPHKGAATHWHLKAGDRVAENAAWGYLNPDPDWAAIKGYLAFDWPKMDAWFEEEEEVFVHPRDPYKRIDVLPSSRHVKVVVDGVTVADTRRPHLLFETSLPTRYYIPQEDVRLDLLQPSDTRTRCPYKGQASYWSVKIGQQVYPDIVWSYPDPIPECPKVRGLLCFFNEKVDLLIDGALQKRPQTPWS